MDQDTAQERDCPQSRPLPEAYDSAADYHRDLDLWHGLADEPRRFEDRAPGKWLQVAALAVILLTIGWRVYRITHGGDL